MLEIKFRRFVIIRLPVCVRARVCRPTHIRYVQDENMYFKFFSSY